jgi:hypothetical protein
MGREPSASRPYMPGYGIEPADQGQGLLSWSWAVERLARSHDYWLATVWPAGRPHLMPVWGLWQDDALWFSSSKSARKAKNIAAHPRCVLATDSPAEPVVVEGDAELVDDLGAIAAFTAWVNGKYGTEYTVDFFDPAANGCWRVPPDWAFGIAEGDFTGSPTRWLFR